MTLSFQQKLWIPLICSLGCMVAIFLYGTLHARQITIDERKLMLQHVDDVAFSVVKQFGEQANAGTLNQADAQKRALAVIKGLRYGKDGYIAISDSQGRAVMHPFKPEADGKDMSGFKDAKGNFMYQDIARVGKSAEGSGYVHYYWTRPGGKEPVEKLGRVMHYAPWQWDIVTGVYVDDIDDSFRATLIETGLVLLAVCALLSWVVRVVNRSLHNCIGGEPSYAGAVARKIASGDLSGEIHLAKGDEHSILFAMAAMRTQLAQTISHIRHSADAIAAASAEIASGNMDLSARTEAQASALEETAASMEQLSSAVAQNAANAMQGNQMAQSAAQIAGQGGQVVGEVVLTMNNINASASRIVDIIGVIDGIAFQTNILALNAAVEAARAGEQGRGFAVVASEVRNLAHRSATAAKEIKGLIGESVDSIRAGAGLVERAGATMTQVVESVTRVTSVMSAISSATGEQSDGIGNVNHAIAEMDAVTQKNAALVEEAAAAASCMQDQAKQLSALVGNFRLGDEMAAASAGQGARAGRPARTSARQLALTA